MSENKVPQSPKPNDLPWLSLLAGKSTFRFTHFRIFIDDKMWMHDMYLDGPWEQRDSWLVAGGLLPPNNPNLFIHLLVN